MFLAPFPGSFLLKNSSTSNLYIHSKRKQSISISIYTIICMHHEIDVTKELVPSELLCFLIISFPFSANLTRVQIL